jgi:hypothetical protein
MLDKGFAATRMLPPTLQVIAPARTARLSLDAYQRSQQLVASRTWSSLRSASTELKALQATIS